MDISLIITSFVMACALIWLFRPRYYGVAIDVSGSQVTFDFPKAFKTLRKGCFGLNNMYHVVYFDTRVYQQNFVTRVRDIQPPRIIGGGSNLDEAMSQFVYFKPIKIFVLSDGYFDKSSEIKYTLIS